MGASTGIESGKRLPWREDIDSEYDQNALVRWNLPQNFFGERAQRRTRGLTGDSVFSITSTTSLSTDDRMIPLMALRETSSDEAPGMQRTKSHRCWGVWITAWSKAGLMFPDEAYEASFLAHYYYTPRFFKLLFAAALAVAILYVSWFVGVFVEWPEHPFNSLHVTLLRPSPSLYH